jgi:hypothetical protein
VNLQDVLVGAQSGIGRGGSGPLVLAAGIVLIVLVVAGVIVYVSYALSPRAKLDALLESRSRARRNPWPERVLVVAILLIVPLSLNYYASRPSTCERCHDTQQGLLLKTAHKELGCMECHSAPGVVGPVNDQISYARWAWAYYVEKRTTTNPALVNDLLSQQCLRCHRSILTGVSKSNGIRVRHSDFLDVGARCGQCHADVSHRDPTSARGPSMNGCLPCHDGKKAPSKCESCHIKDIAQSQSTQNKMQSQKIKISGGPMVCYKCHDAKPCLRCHGVMMPHPPGWGPTTAGGAGGTHPKQGFTNREACFRCHFAPGQPFVGSNESCACHGFLGTMHGGAVWVKEHGLEASGQKPGQLADCAICHVTPEFCQNCHPASIMDSYNPRVGYDEYKRELQPTPNEQAIIEGL